MTAQEIFDKVCLHLAAQKSPSTNGAGQCAYRGLDGRRCAVGILIPDEDYDLLMEGQAVRGMIQRHSHKLGWMEPMISFLMALQNAHDNMYHVDSLKLNLRQIANDYLLDPGAVDAITEWEVQPAFWHTPVDEYYQAQQDDDDDDDDEEDEEPAQEDEEDVEEEELVYV